MLFEPRYPPQATPSNTKHAARKVQARRPPSTGGRELVASLVSADRVASVLLDTPSVIVSEVITLALCEPSRSRRDNEIVLVDMTPDGTVSICRVYL
jgi:hypothetical protein